MKKEELQNRREFFKRAAGRIIPTLVLMSTPSPLLLSCSSGGDDDFDDGELGGDDDNNSGGNSGGNSDDNGLSKATGSVGGHDFVDLGLSVKWATCNIGAASPTGYGDYMEFCEGAASNRYIEVRSDLMRAGYRNKGDSIAGSSFDPAVKRWGSLWRTPTKAEFEELINNCIISEYDNNGKIGIRFKSKKNGKSIFFPGAGAYDGYELIDRIYDDGYYWTSELQKITGSGAYAYFLHCYSQTTGGYRTKIDFNSISIYSMSIRAVTDGKGGGTTGCNNNCTSSCANNSTSSSCSNCSSNCSSGCKTNCDYNCAATCSSHCYGQCNDTCGGGCKYLSAGSSCSGCARTCSGRCYSACTYACSSNCQSSCVHGSK